MGLTPEALAWFRLSERSEKAIYAPYRMRYDRREVTGMAATREDIRDWVEKGRRDGMTHVIVMSDWFDSEDYPVYVKPDQNVYEVESEKREDGDRLMEVYWIEPEADIESQLAARISLTYSADHSVLM